MIHLTRTKVCAALLLSAPLDSPRSRVGCEDANKSGAFLSFSGDAEDEPVDLFGQAQRDVEEADAAEEQEDDDAEPEDAESELGECASYLNTRADLPADIE